MKYISVIGLLFSFHVLFAQNDSTKWYQTNFPADWDSNRDMRGEKGEVVVWSRTTNCSPCCILVETIADSTGITHWVASEQCYDESKNDWYLNTTYLHPSPDNPISNPKHFRIESKMTFDRVPTRSDIRTVMRLQNPYLIGHRIYAEFGINTMFWELLYDAQPIRKDFDFLMAR